MAAAYITNPCLNQLFHQELQKMMIFKFYHSLPSSIKNHFFSLSLSPFYYHEFIDCYLCIILQLQSLFFLMLKLSQIWPLSFRHVPSLFEHFLAFWHNEMSQAYLLLSLPQTGAALVKKDIQKPRSEHQARSVLLGSLNEHFFKLRCNYYMTKFTL